MKFTAAAIFLAAPLLAAAVNVPRLLNLGLPNFPAGTAPATWDGAVSVAYPRPVANFDASKYVGSDPVNDRAVWYQWAAKDQIFLIGCTCVLAKYGSFPNGTVTVENVCTRFGSTSSIKGNAVPQNADVFGKGSLRVEFGFPTPTPGPNYIVQKVYFNKPGQPKQLTGTGRYETVIVSSANFDGWFLLSRTRNVERAVIDDYLKDVAAAGNSFGKPYSITAQTGCPAV